MHSNQQTPNMSSGWIPTAKIKYGIAVYNFWKDGDEFLFLSVGDSVHILEEYKADWYRGCLINNAAKKGIFPKSYIFTKPCVVEREHKKEMVTPDESAIVLEMTNVLREWGKLWKKLYKENKNQVEFNKLRFMLHEVINIRRRIVSGTLPADELIQLKRKVCDIIDIGNNKLGLDMTIRDENYDPVNIAAISGVELYEMYESASTRIQRSIVEEEMKDSGRVHDDDYTPDAPTTTHVHSFYVTVKNFVCRIGEDADVFMALYDAANNSFISENYIVRWGSQGLPKKIEMLNNLKALFTDLGSKDLQREKIYLVCQIVRVGRMELKDNESKRLTTGLRRAFGVSVKNVTSIIKETEPSDEDKQHFIPFIQISGENENLYQLIQRTIISRTDNHKGQGLWLSMKMLHGDVKSVRSEYQHLVDKTTAVVRKMGFPEVIMPGDLRNDLYVTLIQGEFERGSKTAQKNTEVTMSVYDNHGITIPIVVSMGEGEDPENQYRSCIYYQNKNPKWNEIVKVRIPIEDFYNAHLRFTFRHRSTVESKDKNEKDYALSFVKLMQGNGTTLQDQIHNLVVYKLDNRKLDSAKYLDLPSTRDELERTNIKSGKKVSRYSLPRVEGFSHSNDTFQVSTLVCSTKLTQNVNLLGLLKWKRGEGDLEKNLESLMKVDGEEIVKFLQDTLDALFNIMMDNPEDGKYDETVFKALVHIIGLIAEKKFFHFYAVLDTYIEEHFSATLAYEKLTKVLINFLKRGYDHMFKDPLVKTFKALEYIFKFIVQSRVLFQKLNLDVGKQDFENDITEVFTSINELMQLEDRQLIIIQGHAMKYIPSVIQDIIRVFNPLSLSYLLKQFVDNVPTKRLTKQQIQCMLDIVKSSIFKIPACRDVLLKMMTELLKDLMERNDELDSCAKLLADILKLLRTHEACCTRDDIQVLVNSLLRTVTRTVVQITDRKDDKSNLKETFSACFIGLLRQMDEQHYQAYLALYPNEFNLADVLNELLTLFRNLVRDNVFRSDWVSMIQLQNSVFLRAIKFIGSTLSKVFLDDKHFRHDIWDNYFRLGVEFLTQNSLRMEDFTQAKKHELIKKYGDLRCQMGNEIRKMWFNLGRHKIRFIPDMIGPMLQMTLVPEENLRRSTIPIFFDMMQCELHSNGNFNHVKHELITQLDTLIESGKGDANYKNMFYDIMLGWCKKHQFLKQSGSEFVSLVRILLDRLLDYRDIIREDNRDSKMICTVNLLNFYKDKNRNMYVRYLYKLSNLHKECDNNAEAAFTLLEHAKEIDWSDEALSDEFGDQTDVNTRRELKTKLYYEIIELFKRGKLWENGIKLCKELTTQFEQETFQYDQLPQLLALQADLYKNIMNEIRPRPEFFFVGYWGHGFPMFLRNRMFIHRGYDYEHLGDFTTRVLMSLPNASKMSTTKKPGDDIKNSPGMHVQIYTVNPAMEEPAHVKGKTIDDKILGYYKANEVQKFTYQRPFRKGKKDPDNEFATMWSELTTFKTLHKLPGILRCFEVTSVEEKELSPLEMAIETMVLTNEELKQIVNQYLTNDGISLNPLSLKISGIVDARVMGGTSNYEKAFFTTEYMKNHPEDNFKINRLKDLIAMQIPVLSKGIEIHGELAPANLRPLQESMEESFENLQKNVIEKYGERPPYEGPKGRKRAIVHPQRASKMQPARPESIMSIQSYGSDFNLNVTTDAPPEIPAKKKSGVVMRSTSMQQTPTKTESRKSKSDWLNPFGGSSTSLDKDKSSLNGSKNEIMTVELREEITPQRPLRPRSQIVEKPASVPSFDTSSMMSQTSDTANNGGGFPRLPTKTMEANGDNDVKMRRPQNNIRSKQPPPLPVKKHDDPRGTPVKPNRTQPPHS